MTGPHARIDPALRSQIDSVVARYANARRTFTEDEAFSAIWEACYDASPQDDPRFCLAREADGRNPRHWCLASHTVATSELVEALRSETWDGKDLDEQLALLDQQHGGHHVYCPADPRFYAQPDGRIELADDERDEVIPEGVRSALMEFADSLLDQWHQAGSTPWTTRQVTERLAHSGWSEGESRGAWLLVRAWLRMWPAIARVGQDYWVPADAIPGGPRRTRMSVVRIRDDHSPARLEADPPQQLGVESDPVSHLMAIPTTPKSPTGWATGSTARWTVVLRTVNVIEGFFYVPQMARVAYPAPSKDNGRWAVVRGRWFETGESIWVWLDRERHLLCGPDLAERLTWREAGERLEIAWSPDILDLRADGIDPEIHREESRLADVENLASLRGGLGESYRSSIAAVINDSPKGLAFREVAEAVSLRQGHQVHRGTIRSVLHAGGFEYREGRWYTSIEQDRDARTLREAIVLATCSAPTDQTVSHSSRQRLGALAIAILRRLQDVGTQQDG